jgi:uncharacterized protein (TIGR00297 family)
LSLTGAVAAAIAGGVIWEAGGLPMAAPLLAFFISSSLLGRLPRGSEKEGPRTAGQVLANGGVATLAAALVWLDVRQAPTMFVAALCAANADTWATEIGMRFGKKPIRFTALKPVEPGTSGAISAAGILASLAGSAFIAATAYWVVGADLVTAAVAGFAGSLFDSLLGDTVQARFWSAAGTSETGGTLIKGVRWLRNNEVNFAMTAFAAALAFLLAR